MLKPEAVIFDMDGLMLDTERVGLDACQQAAREMSYAIEDATYLRTVGRDEEGTRAVFLEQLGDRFPYEEFSAQLQRCKAAMLHSAGVRIKPGLMELLDHLASLQARLAVATSTSRARAIPLLTSVNIRHRFHALVCGDEIALGKPAPDIFLKAAELLGIEPKDCVVLEDSEAGVMGAHAAGMKPIVVPDLKPPAPHIEQLAWARCASLHDVRALLAG